MKKILITEPIRNRHEFLAALGRVSTSRCPSPKNLDALADYLRENEVTCIIAADYGVESPDKEAVAEVLGDLNVKLVR